MLRLLLIGGLAAAALLLTRRSAGERPNDLPADGLDQRRQPVRPESATSAAAAPRAARAEPARPKGLRREATRTRRPTTAAQQSTRKPVKQRELEVRALAEQLLFRLDKRGQRYSLFRDADVSEPVRHDNLTLKQVEETLETWKMRGLHGG